MSNFIPTADRTNEMVSAHRLLGTRVYNCALENLGVIQDIYIEKASASISYVMVRTGGLLSIHHHSYPLAWKSLTYCTELCGYITDSKYNAPQSMMADRALA
jgi:sporulation protein YlmC with PRC-barrel domain